MKGSVVDLENYNDISIQIYDTEKKIREYSAPQI